MNAIVLFVRMPSLYGTELSNCVKYLHGGESEYKFRVRVFVYIVHCVCSYVCITYCYGSMYAYSRSVCMSTKEQLVRSYSAVNVSCFT